ncbi:MAG: DUF2905 domain-containing protein [Candidatus Marinimicrobia bacterium]|jgi:hypothetical protein|nr:DUF2905 domain-containing protein [Candidatus Neomarinimicrobiota bacterium]
MHRWFITTGIIFVLIGVIMHTAPGLINWFGRLPGDIRIESGQTNIFVPITSMVLISIVLTVLINLLKR